MNTPSSLAVCAVRAAAFAALFGLQGWASAASLADQPVFATSNVPGNLALTLSVEWPTASRTAHTAGYTSNSTYLGYFDPNKCYTYVPNTAVNPVIPVTNPVTTGKGDLSYFNPTGVAVGRKCTGSAALNAMWSGNFLNWAATATIDPFRWAMTGGRRVIDTATETILEKGWHSGQGLFNDRNLTASEIAGATPFDSATSLLVSINGRGFAMRTTTSGAALKGEYFNNMTVTGTPVLTVNNDSADHTWGNASPGTGVNADRFSARYTGSFVAPATGTYAFRVTADDGVRLSVNGTMLINQWRDQGPTDYTANVNLTAGQSFDLQVEYYENAGGATLRLAWQKPGGIFEAFTNSIGAETSNTYTMRNKVCDPNAPGGVESNCKQYGSNWKPEGLIQQYSHRMRFSAFGYLNESGNGRDGGVLRARQKFVGPTQPVPGLPDVTNSEGEWSATDGTFIRNPNAADATASSGSGVTISDSGVINYLNKFGQLLPGNYKGNDPVGELYYAALRYYRNLGNVPEWSNLTTTDAARATQLDGFPVITNWTDPIQYSCQRNFILGIGDIYTHGDKNVPGNTNATNEPTLPTLVANDTAVNAVTATNKVGQLQGMGDDLGTRTNVSNNCCSNNSARMAGLAYDANTKDIRPDLATSPNTIGKQTVQTYWVDVLERAFQVNNQFYLASKYGGLKLPTNIQDTFDPYTFTGPIPTSWWSTNGETLTEGTTTQERPDNYFTAGRPDTMVDGLTKAFASIANAIKSFTTSFSLSTAQVSTSGAGSYASQYDSNGWTGVLTASRLTFVSGVPTLAEVWSSATTLAAQLASGGWDSNRRVVTWNGTTGVPFRSGSLTTDQLAALDTPWAAGNDSVNYLNYLRGDRANERTATDETKPYRLRSALLGDIANAKVTPVGPPSARLSNTVNPGYATFKTTYVNRKTVVYVGANDGMLHAFDGALSGTGAGNELFAYVPSPLFSGPSSPATPTLNGLGQLGNPNYEHRYYVDATPKAFDLDFNTAGGVFTTTAAGGSDWKSLLVGGLGKGGKGFYAIDITDPSTMTTEDLVKAKIKWEFTNATTGVGGTLGFSYGAPLVVKTKKYGWVVVFSSGYNNSDGNGYIYFVNPRDGSLLEKVQTGNASAGLTQMTAYITDYTDGTADAIYAGDLNGQLWRFDITAARGSTAPYPAPLKLATLADANGNAQPITTAPLVEIDPKTKKRYVMLGTGQLLDTVDINSSAAQAFYAIIDGTAALFGSGGTYPLTRSNLEGLSDAELTGQTAINFGTAQGWYIELGSTSSIGWRSVTSATSFNGVVAFATLLTTGNACSPSGQSRVYAVSFGTGVTALVPGDTPYAGYTHAITDLKFISDNGTVRLVAGDIEGKQHVPPVNLGGGSSLRLLNWREIPAVD